MTQGVLRVGRISGELGIAFLVIDTNCPFHVAGACYAYALRANSLRSHIRGTSQEDSCCNTLFWHARRTFALPQRRAFEYPHAQWSLGTGQPDPQNRAPSWKKVGNWNGRGLHIGVETACNARPPSASLLARGMTSGLSLTIRVTGRSTQREKQAADTPGLSLGWSTACFPP